MGKRRKQLYACLCVPVYLNANVCEKWLSVFTSSVNRSFLPQFGDGLLHFAALRQQSTVARYLVKERSVNVNGRNSVSITWCI